MLNALLRAFHIMQDEPVVEPAAEEVVATPAAEADAAPAADAPVAPEFPEEPGVRHIEVAPGVVLHLGRDPNDPRLLENY